MLLINLLAARRAERRKLELIRGVLIRCMFGVGVTAAMGVGAMTYSIQTTHNRIKDVEQQTAMLQDTVTRVETLQGAMAALQPEVTTLLTAQNATNRWRAVLQEVGASLPPKSWLTSFVSQGAPNDGFVVTGQTLSQGRVGTAMMSISGKPYIKSVDLHYIQSGSQNGTVNFELAGAMEPLEGPSNGK